MSVRIRMKKMGRAHRPYYRICAVDRKSPRDGRVLEELGTYDPMVANTDARAVLRAERIDYWIGVGAQPSDKVSVLIKKYGTNGTHADAQRAALDQLAQPKTVPDPGEPASIQKTKEDIAAEAAEAAAAETAAAEAAAAAAAPAAEEAAEPAAEASAAEPAAAEETASAEPAAEETTEEKSE